MAVLILAPSRCQRGKLSLLVLRWALSFFLQEGNPEAKNLPFTPILSPYGQTAWLARSLLTRGSETSPPRCDARGYNPASREGEGAQLTHRAAQFVLTAHTALSQSQHLSFGPSSPFEDTSE